MRVVAATNQPLRPLVAAGRVRADLYYRLNVVCLDLPPLRARRGDIPALVDRFLNQFATSYRRGPLRLDKEAEKILMNYGYPGNVRELENALRRAVILCRGPEILARDLPREMLDAPATADVPREVGFQAAAREPSATSSVRSWSPYCESAVES